MQELRAAAGGVLEVEVGLVQHLPLSRDGHEEAVGPSGKRGAHTPRQALDATLPLQPVHEETRPQRINVLLEALLVGVPELLRTELVWNVGKTVATAASEEATKLTLTAGRQE